MIPFNKPAFTGNEEQYVMAAMQAGHMSGDGPFGELCQRWFEDQIGCVKALLTPSCTSALDMCAMLIDIQPGDEVILPSYTFVSTANAFVLRGAKIVFVDIRPDTMNINETLIKQAITDKTRAIVPVHYAGVGCDMDTIMGLAAKHNLYVVEDAAQGMLATYKGSLLGGIGHLGAYSFHETKNYTSGGEGGLLIVNDHSLLERAEIIREKGTDRSKFFRGQIDKYTWVDLGSSYLPSELQAAYLWGQLEKSQQINNHRLALWKLYYDRLIPLECSEKIELPKIPVNCKHNGHMFYIKMKDRIQRDQLISYLRENEIGSAFHYVPLHSSIAGEKFGIFFGEDKSTTRESERLLRLPLFFGMKEQDVEYVAKVVTNFF